MLYRDCLRHRTAIFAGGSTRSRGLGRCEALLGAALLFATACRDGRPGSHAPQVDEGKELRERVLIAPRLPALKPADASTLSLDLDGISPLPLYDAAIDHPWNRLHHALYVQPGKVSRTSCLPSSTAPDVLRKATGCGQRAVPLDPWPPSQEGPAWYADSPSLLVSPMVEHLVEPSRAGRVLALLQAASARAEEKRQRPWAALLLQSDLWERHDALDAAARSLMLQGQATPLDAAHQQRRDRLLWLRDAMAPVIRALALPAEQLRSIDSNLPLLAASYPQLLPDFPGPEWVEIITRSRSMPEPHPSPSFEYTRHASVAGFRAVFRRFVRVPSLAGGALWLRRELASEPAAPRMPPGTRLLILQQPLAIAESGELVLWPRTDLIELRTVDSPVEPGLQAATPKRLIDLKFDVLEGQRSLLRQASPVLGGLQALAPDAPFPMGGSCSPQPTVLAPLRAVCMTCHGQVGDIIHGAMTHGPQNTRVLSDPARPFVAVRDEKLRRPELQALLRSF